MPADGTVADGLAAAALSLARRYAAGATMWCVSPAWPAHGDHVAVEFVHPVIVGKRALPAVHVRGGVAQLRLLARPGDVVLAIGPAGDQDVAEVLRRAEAWGLARIWVGAGQAPPPGRAEHVIWLEEADPALAARSGEVVLLYHLLWELTHVVFEHPGLLEDDPACEPGACITCSDEGRVAEVQAVDRSGSAEVLVGGIAGKVDVSLVGAVASGDLLLVHAGVALSSLVARWAP